MENGEIKEKGTHEELMKKKGLYYQLVTNQVFTDAPEICSGNIECILSVYFFLST